MGKSLFFTAAVAISAIALIVFIVNSDSSLNKRKSHNLTRNQFNFIRPSYVNENVGGDVFQQPKKQVKAKPQVEAEPTEVVEAEPVEAVEPTEPVQNAEQQNTEPTEAVQAEPTEVVEQEQTQEQYSCQQLQNAKQVLGVEFPAQYKKQLAACPKQAPKFTPQQIVQRKAHIKACKDACTAELNTLIQEESAACVEETLSLLRLICERNAKNAVQPEIDACNQECTVSVQEMEFIVEQPVEQEPVEVVEQQATEAQVQVVQGQDMSAMMNAVTSQFFNKGNQAKPQV